MENLHGLPRRRKWAVRVAAVGAGAAVALLGLGSPASADVSLLPTPTTQGGAANLTFRVTNDSAVATVNRIEIRLPEDNPIAEVYPLSADDWAPAITTRTLAEPLQSVHGGGTVTDATAAVTWTAMPGHELKPGKSADLTLTAGPLPTTSQLVIGVIVSRSDGVVERYTRAPGAATGTIDERPAVVISLQPGPGDAAAAHGHDAAPAAAGNTANPTTEKNTPYIKWVLVVLVLLGGLTIFSLYRQRRAAAPPPDKEKELVSSGT